ncbi:hypothetical protein JCM13210_13800 [Thermaerobacter litoralis]
MSNAFRGGTLTLREILGTAVIAVTYVATYIVAALILNINRPTPEGLPSAWAQPLAVALSTIPYAVGGVYAISAWRHRTLWQPALLGFAAALIERAIILGGGYLTFLADVVRPTSPDVLGFIQAEAAPYFTPTYIIVGLLVSPLVTTLAAALAATFRHVVR